MIKIRKRCSPLFLSVLLLGLGYCGRSPDLPVPQAIDVEPDLTQVKVSWQLSDNPALYIRVQYKKSNDEGDFSIAGTVTDKTNYIITNLIPETKYQIRLQTLTVDGNSEYSSVTDVRTLALPKVDQVIAVGGAGPNIVINWMWVNLDRPDVVESYVIERKENSGNWRVIDTIQITDGDLSSLTYTDDKAHAGPDIYYRIHVNYIEPFDSLYSPTSNPVTINCDKFGTCVE